MKKTLLLSIAVLLSLDAAFLFRLRRLSGEREGLARKSAELESRSRAGFEAGEHDRNVEAVVEHASERIPEIELDIASLRDLLIGAERGLDIDRLSLEFRPAQEGADNSGANRVSASLGGSFGAIYGYLGRVEALRLPLATEDLSLRQEPSGRILLDVDWTAFSGTGGLKPPDFNPGEVARIEGWLARNPSPMPDRNPFSGGAVIPEPIPTSDAPRIPSEPQPALEAPLEEDSVPTAPELTGFVLARAELETDVGRRVLAAIRFDGELKLVAEGEVFGPFRVESMEARESVVLLNEETGERLKLVLE